MYTFEPLVRSQHVALRSVTWEAVDEAATAWLGIPCLALPSVRVGICWSLDWLGMARHRDHVVVPRFVGRCILNAVGRFAFPVEDPTASTRLAIVIDQYGLRQDMKALRREFNSQGWRFVEDSPYGIGADERPSPGAVARFIGLGKVFPLALGALCATEDRAFADVVRAKRRQSSGWALPVWATMSMLRRWPVPPRPSVAELAYEMYPAAVGGHGWLRGSMARVLRNAWYYEAETRARLGVIRAALGAAALLPDLDRIGYVVPCFAGGDLERPRSVLRQFGFDDSPYHVDLARNMLAPDYQRAVMLPLNPDVPMHVFEACVRTLADTARPRAEGG